MPPADVSAKASPAASQPRDRWFHGVHAHFVPSMSRERDVPPGAAVALAPPSSLKDLDVYGTLREKHVRLSRGQIRAMYSDVRERTKRALAGLSPAQLRAVPEPSLNPFDWGLGHIAHFYEFMILRLLAPETPEDAFLPGHDKHALFDSFRAAHDDRWRPAQAAGSDPCLAEIQDYLDGVTNALLDCVGRAFANANANATTRPKSTTTTCCSTPCLPTCTSTASCTSTGTSRTSSKQGTRSGTLRPRLSRRRRRRTPPIARAAASRFKRRACRQNAAPNETRRTKRKSERTAAT
jgi:hypothetical protein